jgi:hypothetical protein
MKIIPLALAAALSFSASLALAQTYNAADMKNGLSMIETNAAMAFKEYGIDADPMKLSLGQLGQISALLVDPEQSSGGNSVKAALEAIISAK